MHKVDDRLKYEISSTHRHGEPLHVAELNLLVIFAT